MSYWGVYLLLGMGGAFTLSTQFLAPVYDLRVWPLAPTGTKAKDSSVPRKIASKIRQLVTGGFGFLLLL